MVQTGVYRGYPQPIKLLAEVPYTEFYIYNNPNNPNYPGYTLMKNDSGWHPPDSEYISIFSRIPWVSVGSNYRYWHYLFYGDEITLSNINLSRYNIYVSGASNNISTIYVDDVLLLYSQETDVLLNIDSKPSYLYQQQNITTMLQSGINHILWFCYSGRQWINGSTEYYEYSSACWAKVYTAYILSVPK